MFTGLVQQVATAGKVSYDNVPDATPASGTLKVSVGSAAPISIDLAAANTNGGTLSVREIAAAINNSSANTGLVSAGVVTVPVVGTDGLSTQVFRDGTAYQGEDLILDPQRPEQFLLRCTRLTSLTPPMCLHERRIGGAEPLPSGDLAQDRR